MIWRGFALDPQFRLYLAAYLDLLANPAHQGAKQVSGETG